jgi:hypothetical protein
MRSIRPPRSARKRFISVAGGGGGSAISDRAYKSARTFAPVTNLHRKALISFAG